MSRRFCSFVSRSPMHPQVAKINTFSRLYMILSFLRTTFLYTFMTSKGNVNVWRCIIYSIMVCHNFENSMQFKIWTFTWIPVSKRYNRIVVKEIHSHNLKVSNFVIIFVIYVVVLKVVLKIVLKVCSKKFLDSYLLLFVYSLEKDDKIPIFEIPVSLNCRGYRCLWNSIGVAIYCGLFAKIFILTDDKSELISESVTFTCPVPSISTSLRNLMSRYKPAVQVT